MEIDHRKILDDITTAMQDFDKLKEADKPRVRSEDAMALTFRKGMKVIDKVTGLEGEVIYGARKIAPISGPRSR